MHWFYYGGRFIAHTLFLLSRREVRGAENVPSEGPLLIVANHLSLADPPLLAISIKRKMMFMSKEELFRGGFTTFCIKNFGAFPVNRSRLTRAALESASQYLKQGMAIVMFPEGKRSPNGCLEEAFPGSAMIALRYHAPILPVGIIGTEIIHGWKWIPHWPKLLVNIGKPFRLPQSNGKVSKEELCQCTESIMTHIAALLPSKYRGAYGMKNEV